MRLITLLSCLFATTSGVLAADIDTLVRRHLLAAKACEPYIPGARQIAIDTTARALAVAGIADPDQIVRVQAAVSDGLGGVEVDKETCLTDLLNTQANLLAEAYR